jgi:hypothetical protein
MFRIGDKVKAHAFVITKYYAEDFATRVGGSIIHSPSPKINSDGIKCLVRVPQQVDGVIIGWTMRQTGRRYFGHMPTGYDFDDYEPTTFESDKHHKVWLIAKSNSSQRYFQPIACLEEDLEEVDDILPA